MSVEILPEDVEDASGEEPGDVPEAPDEAGSPGFQQDLHDLRRLLVGVELNPPGAGGELLLGGLRWFFTLPRFIAADYSWTIQPISSATTPVCMP